MEQTTDDLSFIDLSDEEDDGISKDSLQKRRHRDPSSPSAHSFFDSLSPEEQERRRKRERIAKLHRFLGSRVPAGLVLGISESSPSLPPPDESMAGVEDRKTWLKRRRSSSAAAFPITISDRLKEDLDEQEKAINVRRAVKMETFFGIAPPQTLYLPFSFSPSCHPYFRQISYAEHVHRDASPIIDQCQPSIIQASLQEE
jgi:hypothetical protein